MTNYDLMNILISNKYTNTEQLVSLLEKYRVTPKQSKYC